MIYIGHIKPTHSEASPAVHTTCSVQITWDNVSALKMQRQGFPYNFRPMPQEKPSQPTGHQKRSPELKVTSELKFLAYNNFIQHEEWLFTLKGNTRSKFDVTMGHFARQNTP